MLTKSVKTIVEQVDAMKRLVNEFRDYARLPAAELQPLDLNTLVSDVLYLYGAENATIPVESELDARCPPIAGMPNNCARWCTTCCRTRRTPPNRPRARAALLCHRCASPRGGANHRGVCA